MAITFIMLRSTSKLVNIHLPLDIASSLPKAVLFFVRVMFITVNTFQLFYIHNITCYNFVSMTFVLSHKYSWHVPIKFIIYQHPAPNGICTDLLCLAIFIFTCPSSSSK